MTAETDVKKMKVADLHEALKKHGLSTDGLKADLQKRLIDAQDAASASETTPKKVMSKAEKQEALARARLWANKRHTTVADPSTTESVAGEGVMTEDDPPSSSDRGSRRMAAMRKRRYQAKGSGSDKTVEEEKEDVANDTTTSNVPPSELRSSSTRTSAANQKKTSTGNSSRGYYLIAIIPIVLLVGASHFLRATISAPPSDYGSGSMFDLIATRYDFINRALALNLDMSWRKRLVQEIVGPQGELFTSTYTNDGESSNVVKILDLATGTADVAILLGKAAALYNTRDPPPSVLGLDPSQNMLNVGNTKVQNADLTNIVRLELGDARNLASLTDETFNAVTMSFGIRNVIEKEKALCEIHRVLKKGVHYPNIRTSSPLPIESRLAIMEFSEPGPESGIMGTLARLFIRHCLPAIGALLSGFPKEYMHLQKSIADFPSPSEFVALMEKLKCRVKSEGGDGDEYDNHMFGSFRVKEVVNLNFGSVQIYVATPILRRRVTE